MERQNLTKVSHWLYSSCLSNQVPLIQAIRSSQSDAATQNSRPIREAEPRTNVYQSICPSSWQFHQNPTGNKQLEWLHQCSSRHQTHLISCPQVSEFVLSFGVVLVPVRVQLKRQLSVRFFDVPDGSTLTHPQNLIEVSPTAERWMRHWRT